jgi:hydrogenase expression/formation protein HypD
MTLSARQWLQKIHALPLQERIRVMNVCGGHERAITQAGLRTLLPDTIELIPGPGCPVCICPEEDIYAAIQIALRERVILAAFGDMLRVPINVPKKSIRTLADAKAHGADIRPVASPQEVITLARQHPDKMIVFFCAGFETTTAPVIGLLAEGVPQNVQLLLSGRRTWPAIAMLLKASKPGFDCLVAPGHVATVMGANEWQFICKQYDLPAAIAGFDAQSLLAAIYSVARQHLEQKSFLDNCYSQLVSDEGNLLAKKLMESVTDIVDAKWRGIGVIEHSGFALKKSFASYDARITFGDYNVEARKRAGQMPAGCDCASVVLGKIYPHQCRLYGAACTPRSPVGPCMVSDEGACRIWWASGVKQKQTA